MPITRGGRADFLLQHTSACVLHMDMHACALIKSFVHSFARLLETPADYLAPWKDLALIRRAARAVATEATSHASPAGWSTTENMAFICTSSAVRQQDADAAYCDVAALSSWALNATERNPRSTSMSLCIAAGAQISEETLVPSYVIEQLELQLMPADDSNRYCYFLNSMQATAHISA